MFSLLFGCFWGVALIQTRKRSAGACDTCQVSRGGFEGRQGKASRYGSLSLLLASDLKIEAAACPQIV